jgi:diguanylate cyclase (GGDEF)-like protein/PAS domain S-box-containing protein
VSPGASVTGIDHRDFIGGRFNDLPFVIKDDDLACFKAQVEMRQSFTFEYVVDTALGGRRWFLLKGMAMFKGGEFVGYRGTGKDVSERKKADDHLRLAASVFEATYDGIVVTDSDGRIIDVNPAFERMTGYALAEVVGKTPAVLQSGNQPAEFYHSMWSDLKQHGHWKGELWNRKKSGEVFAEMLTISSVRDTTGVVTRYVGIFSDITMLKQHQSHLETVASHDALTQLPNRRRLQDNLALALVSARATDTIVGVCYIDLDGFKPVNDVHGHAVGDHLLIDVAKRLKGCVRANDTVARIGGDEFVILLTGMDSRRECKKSVTRILTEVSSPYDLGEGRTVKVTASIGIALFHQDDIDPDTLLRHADQAMYQAKNGGKNRYCMFDPSMTKEMDERSKICNSFAEAVDAGQVLLHYQPKVNMMDGTLNGVEALMRWNHPEKGLLAPGAFLASIENSPVEIRIGFWVIDEAMRQIAEWRKRGRSIQISVNIPGRLLLHENFAQRVRALLAKHPGADGKMLQMEILESVALENIEAASEVIRECKVLGITFALDDFGTGYSSLTYLKRLAIDVLKIDQSFVSSMINTPEDFAIVEGVAWLSEAFGRTVVAEGVESDAHGSMLLRLGCQLGQGFGIAKAMPPEEILTWAAGWKVPEAWKQVSRWDREDLTLLEAEVAHRQWVADIYKVVDTKNTDIVIEHNAENSRLGRWMTSKPVVKYTNSCRQEFAKLETLHRQVHSLGARIVEAVQDGRHDEARAGWLALVALRDRILKVLHGMAYNHAVGDVMLLEVTTAGSSA